jgi:hypothetical protein
VSGVTYYTSVFLDEFIAPGFVGFGGSIGGKKE